MPAAMRDAAARLCDEAAARWHTRAPGAEALSDAQRLRGNEASALAAAIRAQPVADDAAERAARGAAWELAELRATVAMLRPIAARVVDAEAEAARRTDEVVAIGEALGRPGATGAECVAAIRALATGGEGR
jgi:hypothetical protein